MKLRTIENLDLRGKYVLLRDDFNVQIVDGTITEPFKSINSSASNGSLFSFCPIEQTQNGSSSLKNTLKYAELKFSNVEFSQRVLYLGVPSGFIVWKSSFPA